MCGSLQARAFDEWQFELGSGTHFEGSSEGGLVDAALATAALAALTAGSCWATLIAYYSDPGPVPFPGIGRGGWG